jgi:hypothetical protein
VDDHAYHLILDRTGTNVVRPVVINAFNSDHANGSNPFLTFSVNVPVDLYVFVDDDSCSTPSWLNAQGFRPCSACGDFTLDHPTDPRQMQLWTKSVLQAGQIQLGFPNQSCAAGLQNVMYIVDVVKR